MLILFEKERKFGGRIDFFQIKKKLQRVEKLKDKCDSNKEEYKRVLKNIKSNIDYNKKDNFVEFIKPTYFILWLLTKNKSCKRTYFQIMAGLTLQGSNSLKDIITTLIPLKLRKYAI